MRGQACDLRFLVAPLAVTSIDLGHQLDGSQAESQNRRPDPFCFSFRARIVPLRPVGAVERAIVDCFGDMGGFDFIGVFRDQRLCG